jgi:hypothetical protein
MKRQARRARGRPAAASGSATPVSSPPAAPELHRIRRPDRVEDLLDWGPIAEPVRGASRTRGRLLYKAEGGAPEAGIWECTPGVWKCRVERDEFCHFLSGRCVYTDESGRRTAIEGGDIAMFPAGWNGVCEVIDTVRKVYMIR